MMKRCIEILMIVVVVMMIPACAMTAPTSDFRMDFLTAVQSDCAIDKVAVNKDKIQIKCQLIPQEDF